MSRFSDAHTPGRTTRYEREKYKIVAPMDMTVISDGVVVHSNSTSSVQIARETDIENVRGGASLGTVTFAEVDNGLTVTISELLYDLSMLEQQTGTDTRTWTQIPIVESMASNDGTLEVTETTVDGEAVAIDSASFGKTVHLQLMGYLHDLDEDKVVGRFYWIFPNAKLSSNLDITYEAEVDEVEELVFEIQEIEGTSTYGHRVIVLDEGEDTALAIAKPGGEIVEQYESGAKDRAVDGVSIFDEGSSVEEEPIPGA